MIGALKQVESKLALFIVFVMIVMTVSNVYAKESFQSLQSDAYTFLKYVEEGKNEAAEATLAKMERVVDGIDSTMTEVGPYSLHQLMKDARLTLMDQESSKQEAYHRSLAVVLYVDAMETNVDPLWEVWKSYTIQEINQLIEGDEKISNRSIKHVYELYERMLPAMYVDLDWDVAQQMSLHQQALVDVLSEQSTEDRMLLMRSIARDLEEIPVTKYSLTEGPEFIWLIWTIGSFISITLTYVGWRKYRAEKRQLTKSKERDS
ncbi:sporulation protein YpjB [Pontibacillus litoralis]|uniref:Sporulation protein YpjB n=1 Tax=Pontibacillus litoralis JSM 072002 TaxID=1385512 RepID=A0A0A5HWP6_9BACI|nr:sporulation protein YpjB [Pontibacillus litoralis]KGX88027.1 hypothetical protein N784_12695 [Pontibacillus litoralis JSM 072002]